MAYKYFKYILIGIALIEVTSSKEFSDIYIKSWGRMDTPPNVGYINIDDEFIIDVSSENGLVLAELNADLERRFIGTYSTPGGPSIGFVVSNTLLALPEHSIVMGVTADQGAANLENAFNELLKLGVDIQTTGISLNWRLAFVAQAGRPEAASWLAFDQGPEVLLHAQVQYPGIKVVQDTVSFSTSILFAGYTVTELQCARLCWLNPACPVFSVTPLPSGATGAYCTIFNDEGITADKLHVAPGTNTHFVTRYPQLVK